MRGYTPAPNDPLGPLERRQGRLWTGKDGARRSSGWSVPDARLTLTPRSTGTGSARADMCIAAGAGVLLICALLPDGTARGLVALLASVPVLLGTAHTLFTTGADDISSKPASAGGSWCARERGVLEAARGLYRQYGYGEIGEAELDGKLGEIRARARSPRARLLLAATGAAVAEKVALRRLYREGALSRENLRMLEAEVDERLDRW